MNIRTEREAAGINQAELARRTGIHQSKLSKMETGLIQPTVGEETLIRAAFTAEDNALQNEENSQPAPEGTDYSEDDYSPRCQPYPAAPKDVAARRLWVAQRNHNFQTKGVPAPESGTFGPGKKAKA